MLRVEIAGQSLNDALHLLRDASSALPEILPRARRLADTILGLDLAVISPYDYDSTTQAPQLRTISTRQDAGLLPPNGLIFQVLPTDEQRSEAILEVCSTAYSVVIGAQVSHTVGDAMEVQDGVSKKLLPMAVISQRPHPLSQALVTIGAISPISLEAHEGVPVSPNMSDEDMPLYNGMTLLDRSNLIIDVLGATDETGKTEEWLVNGVTAWKRYYNGTAYAESLLPDKAPVTEANRTDPIVLGIIRAATCIVAIDQISQEEGYLRTSSYRTIHDMLERHEW